MPSNAIVLVGRSRDAEFAALAADLGKASIPCVRITAEELAGASFSVDPTVGRISWNGTTFTPSVTWIRHFSMRAAAAGPDRVATLLRNDSWETLVAELSSVSTATIGDSPPGQLRQLRDAARLGVRVPGTRVVNNLDARWDPPWEGPFMAKTLDRHYIEDRPGNITFLHPRLVPLNKWPEFQHAWPADVPYILQEYVPHSAEIRLYLFGEDYFSFSVKKESPSDIWSDPERVLVTPVEPPPAVLDAARLLADVWALPYGAFDFLVDDQGPIFLEVNAHGDWSWYERQASVAEVSSMASRFATGLHRSSTRESSGPDLLTFLGARTGIRSL